MQVPQTNLSRPCQSPLTVGACATLACIWEATAPKPGNVYRGADFEDLTYADFVTSAAVIGPVLEQVGTLGVGRAIQQAAVATREMVGTNTNLGLLLLLAPLAAVPGEVELSQGLGPLLTSLTVQDTRHIYDAVRVANPAGLGHVAVADIRDESAPPLTPLEVMQLAAERDLIARQYVTNYAQVFAAAQHIADSLLRGVSLSEAIVRAFLTLLAEHPDSLIARKCGQEQAEQVSLRAASIVAAGETGQGVLDFQAVADFDFWLRAADHRLNPGTTADLIAAGLFVLLREGRLTWPVRYYGERLGARG